MADDFDSLDDIFGDEPVKNARVVGKFRPRPKLQLQKKALAKSSVASTQAVQTVQPALHDLSEPIETGKTLELSSDVVANDKADLHAFVGKSIEENADVLVGSEAIPDSLPHTSTECTATPSETVALNAPNAENIGGSLGIQVSSSIDGSTNTCKSDVPKDPGSSAEVDALAAGEPMVSSADVHNDKDDRPGTEEMNVMDSINTTELTTKSGKFQPKLNLQKQNKTYEASGSRSYSFGLESGPIHPDSTEKDLSPTFQHDDAVDLSSPACTRTLPTESTSELRLSEGSMNILEVPQSDSCGYMEGLPEIPAKLASRRAKTGNSKTNAASDPRPQQQKASTSSQENETGRALRPRKGKKKFYELVDEDEDEINASREFSEERPFSSAIDEENINGEQPQVENEPQKKNLKRKSKKSEKDKEKPPRKSKKAKEVSEQETPAKPKKFSHTTRRRRVDKNLLNIPEEEFDPREVSLRDLILLAEHRERQMKTDQAAAGAPGTQESDGNSTGLHNDEANMYGAGGESNDEEGSPIEEDTTEYFNYQSRMEKTPRVRWSKQDTELFYKAVQQFGTDFSMITQLFPGRSREQIRNKYKKEERQHPLRLREALTTRSKDLSYFEKVIENLNQIRAKQDEEDLEEELAMNEGADKEPSNADDDEAKHERVEEEENGDAANGSTEVQSSPVKGEEEEEEEEELLLWSQYKSDI